MRHLSLTLLCMSLFVFLVFSGCGQDPIEPVERSTFVNPSQVDKDGDFWYGDNDSSLDMSSFKLLGGGDCDNNPDDDPSICRAIEGVNCHETEYSVCASCINPGADETCLDGVDNDCDGIIDGGPGCEGCFLGFVNP